MKKTGFALFVLLFIQMNAYSQQSHAYEKEWEKIAVLEKQQLIRSAWNEVNAIYKQAAAHHDDQQQVKALIYQMKYREQIEPNASVDNIREADSLTQKATGIPKAVLQSMLAEMYRGYVNRHRYQLYGRLTSAGENTNDITTWSLTHFYQVIADLYKASLRNETELKKTALQKLQVIVDTGKNTLSLQPTLYDLLVHRALDYFTGEEQYVIKPAEHFIIDQPVAFAAPAVFADAHFEAKDTSSLPLSALYLYRDLIRFHLKDKDPDALMDVNLQRLQYVYRKAVMADKDSLYSDALERIMKGSYGKAVISQAAYLLASYYYQQASLYNPLHHPGNRFDLKKTLEICETIPVKPITEGSVDCNRLRSDILSADLSLQAEFVNVPHKPFRVLVSYKNVFHLYFRLIKLPDDPLTVFSDRSKNKDVLLKMPVYRQWEQAFPDRGDYRHHAAEMKADGLPFGRYALIVAGNKDFSGGKTPVESVEFFVSDMSYINDNKGNYIIVNRETGNPVAGAKVTMWKTFYNETKRKTDIRAAGDYTTDQQGLFKVKTPESYSVRIPEITIHGDHLFTGEPVYTPYVSSENNSKDTSIEKTYLFTDRSVYRPGQTVCFKGIVINYSPFNYQGKTVSGRNFTIYLYDVNNQKVDSLQLITNDFGSYAGSFTIPEGLLNGQMHIEVKDQQAYNYFSVEDYKRPTFYLKWDTVAHAYQLGDEVSVKGSVIAYSQAVVDGAAVKYQVTRRTQIRFPFPWYRRGPVIPRSEEAVISQGATKTDAKGNFDITFPAIPDAQTDSNLHPVFIYTVSADVTDINGESHPFSYHLPVGYTSLQLAIEGNDKINKRKEDTLYISSTNLTGKYIPSDIHINIYPLISPGRFIRARYWPQPDEYILDKKEYLKYFPHDEYKDESLPDTWKQLPSVKELTQEVSANTSVIIPFQKLNPGWYAIRVTGKDERGSTISAIKYLQVYDPEIKNPEFYNPLWISTNEITAQPGDKVSWYLSSDQQVHVIAQKETLSQTGSIQHILLNNEVRSEGGQLNEDERGGIIYNYVTVKDNRLFSQSIRINVPWKNKQLYIQYETFRDKMLPGAKEEWRLKITGADGQRVSAELLASMYDASLDAFRPHSWQLPDIHPSVYERISWTGGNNFSGISSSDIFPAESVPGASYEKIYPSLRWFGYSPLGYRLNIQYAFTMSAAVRDQSSKRNPNVNESRIMSKEEGTPVPMADTSNNKVSDEFQNILPRKNFNETAFFLPQLHTDDSGNVIFSFTMPEALTRWKLLMFAHTKELQFAYSDREVVTQKPLMIQANAPRFVRQGDELIFSAKISDLSKDNLQGNARLELTDAVTGTSLNDLFQNKMITKRFAVNAGQSAVVKWNISVPENYTGALSYKVEAAAGSFSDGEQNVLPVLTNKTLITESLPLNFRGNGTHYLDWDALNELNKSSSVQPLGLTIEYTGNPVWYAVQALPFLDEDKLQSADVLYNHFYANVLSGFIAKEIPHFRDIMKAWLTKDTDALKSPLQQNEDLKTVMLQETPWVQTAQNESAQKYRIASWFDQNDFKANMQAAVMGLQKLQLSNGGFSWFKDMPDDRYITQHILTGIGRLNHLNAWPEDGAAALNQIVQKAIPYLDARMKEDYDRLKRDKVKDPQISQMDIQYLYMRSFFPGLKMTDSIHPAYRFYQRLASQQWQDKPPYSEAMIALEQYRSGNEKIAKAILRSLSETAMMDPVKGMYWKNNQYGYQWWQAPVEAQSLCIAAFNEIDQDDKTVSDLATWLLTQKETRRWATGRATADAVYAMLLAGKNWASASPEVTIRAGDHVFSMNSKNSETGTQYKEEYIRGKKITSKMNRVEIKIEKAAKDEPSWGALYFQYLENMNKVKNSSSPMQIERQISLEKITPHGPELIPVDKHTLLKVGDKVQIRLVVKALENMDYVHLKDVRASCMEPLQTISGYHFQDGAGYYFTMTDAAVHYYFPHLNKGVYVFTYPVYITHTGDYTGGLSTIECLYAPVFRAHSEGIRLNIN